MAATFSIDARFTRVAVLSPTKFVAVYREETTGEARAVAGIVLGGGVISSIGSPVIMDPAPAGGILDGPYAVAALDPGHALAVWAGATGAQAAVLTVSGTVVAVGPPNQFAPGAEWVSIAPLAPGGALIAFRRNDGATHFGAALIAIVAGSDVTFGPTRSFNGNDTSWISAAVLTRGLAGRVAIAFRDWASAGRALIVDVAETLIYDVGESAVFQTGVANLYAAVAGLGGGRFAVAYAGVGGKGYVRVGTVSGLSVALGLPKMFYSGPDLYGVRMRPLGPDQAVLLARIGDAASNICADMLATRSGDAMIFGPPLTSVPNTVGYFDLDAEENGTVVAVYRLDAVGEGKAQQLGRYELAAIPGRGKFSDDADYCAVAKLSSTKFIVFFRARSGGPSLASAAVGTLSGTDITFGETVVVDGQSTGGYTSSLAVVGLDPTHAVAVWGGESPARAAVLTITGGTSVAVGQPGGFAPAHSDLMNAVHLGAGNVLIAFREDGGEGKAVLATVSGADITLGAPHPFSAAVSASLRAAQLSSTKAVIAFNDAAHVGKALIAAVGAGGAMTFGTPMEFQSGEIAPLISLMKLDEHGENFAVAYVHGKGYAKVGTVSGTGMGITFGQPTELYPGTDLKDMCIARLDASHGAVVTREASDDGRDRLVTFDAPIAVSPPGAWFTGGGSPLHIAAAALDGENVIVVCRDGLSGDGVAVLRQYEYELATSTTTEPPGTPDLVGNLSSCRAAKLSSTKFVVVWRDYAGKHACAAVGRLDGTEVEFGPPQVMDDQWSGTGTDTFAVVRLDSSRALAVWRRYQPADDQIMACVLTKRGALRVEAGEPALVFTGDSGNSLQCLEPVLLGAGKVLIASQNQISGRLSTVVATVAAGGAITFGGFHELVGPAVTEVRAAALSSARAVIAFQDIASGDGKAVVATVSGTDVTFGAPATFQTGNQVVSNISVLKLGDGPTSDARFAVAYKGEVAYTYGVVKVGTVSGAGGGATIAFGAANMFASPSENLKGTRLSWLAPDRMSFVYLDGVDGRDMLVTVDGDDADFGASRAWFTGTAPLVMPVIDSTDAVAMDSQNAIVFYRDYTSQDIRAALLRYEAGPFVTTTTSHPPVTVGSPNPPPGGESPPNPPATTTTTTQPPPPVTKWERPPDETESGVDIRACDAPGGPAVVLADDWPCDQRGELAGIWLWCSFLADQLPPGGLPAPFLALRLSVHADIPQGPHGHSCPGELLWEHYFVPGVDCAAAPHATVPQGEWFWDPGSQDPPLPAGDQAIFRIDCDLGAPGVPPFVQEGTVQEPRVYWLDAQAFLPPDAPAVRFGWKTTAAPGHWNDAACFSAADQPEPADWHALAYPPPHPQAPAPVGMAFGVSFRPLAPPATTQPPATTTQPPTTTQPTTTAPPTTAPPATTTRPLILHPADAGRDWACQTPEVLAWADAWLAGGVPHFLGESLDGPGVAQAYILRSAAIALANGQARYQDGGSSEPVNSAEHPGRWLEEPDV